MAKKIKAHMHHKATAAMTTRASVLTSEALYFLTIYNLGPVMMWAKELVS